MIRSHVEIVQQILITTKVIHTYMIKSVFPLSYVITDTIRKHGCYRCEQLAIYPGIRNKVSH